MLTNEDIYSTKLLSQKGKKKKKKSSTKLKKKKKKKKKKIVVNFLFVKKLRTC